MPEFALYSTTAVLGIFAASAIVIASVGTRMAAYADNIANRTGLGEALIGSVLLGAGTSIAGIIASANTAANGAPDLSVSNAMGGIAAQTMFLALADIAYRRVNLEHAAASPVNLGQATILIILASLPLIAWAGPDIAVFGIHPVTPVLIGAYLVGLHNAHRIKQEPMWLPRRTKDTRREDDDDCDDRRSLWVLLAIFGAMVAVVGLCGWIVGETGLVISGRLGISQGVVGALGTAIVTSLPELVTTLAAVRRGALQLAVGGIIGGNMFDALFVAAGDIAYREGSIYNAISERTIFWVALVILMTAILLLGLLRREKEGPGGIGWESSLLLGLWLGGASLQIMLG